MRATTDSLKLTASAHAPLKPETPAPRVYDCTGCRYVDAHGLVCDACLRKILDSQAERKASLIAACFEGRGCFILLRGKRAALG